ncbi:hypothetical protein L2E82_45717 [Cichorium intybus]|uniref:Uncharacterized protein n=1 Tax=Cichorium intybus TaxID=13427 RepID=A0ACB8ZTQ8_CICIN|nr:hypothetical protein L2E82_45717 [Cichorium intybus]
MLGELRLDTMKIHIYDSFLQGHFYDHLVQQGHIQNFKKQVVALLDSINYWQNRGIPRIDVDLEFIMETWVPQQSGPLGDCAADEDYTPTDYAARKFRERMGRIYWASRSSYY